MPEQRQGYRSKTQLALELLERALERGHLLAGWVAADDAFGMSPSFREGLAALGMRYVLDVPAGFTMWPPELGRQRAPLLPVQRSGGYPIGDPGLRGWLKVAYRNGVRDGKERRGSGRVRDSHPLSSTGQALGGLASPRRFALAGRSVSPEPATGLGGERCPGSRDRRSTGWCGRCCPGNGSDQMSCCGGRSRRKNAMTGPDAPPPSVAPPFAHPRTSLLEPSL